MSFKQLIENVYGIDNLKKNKDGYCVFNFKTKNFLFDIYFKNKENKLKVIGKINKRENETGYDNSDVLDGKTIIVNEMRFNGNKKIVLKNIFSLIQMMNRYLNLFEYIIVSKEYIKNLTSDIMEKLNRYGKHKKRFMSMFYKNLENFNKITFLIYVLIYLVTDKNLNYFHFFKVITKKDRTN